MNGVELVFVLKAWLLFVLVIAELGHSRLAARNNYQQNENNNPGFISIDCGVKSGENYFDEEIGIFYKSDIGFVDTGTNSYLPLNIYSQNPNYGRLVETLKSFPQGTKNCYTLKPEQGKNSNYLIRALFYYGNYDNKNQAPKFDVYVGVNYWTTMQMHNASAIYFPEIIHVPSSDTIFVCLMNTGYGVPFISALELRHLDNSSYRIESSGLITVKRLDMGSPIGYQKRYKDDVYDRFWANKEWPNVVPITTSSAIDVQGSKDGYKPPPQVLRTALVPASGYNDLNFSFDFGDGEYYIYLHFAEIQKLGKRQKREFNIYLNGVEYLKEPITLDYLKPLSISPQNGPITTGKFSLYLNATIVSQLPPILNALEIFKVVPLPLLSTEIEDVTAIMDIRQTYRINIDSWQGDPCVPSNFSWNNLTCSFDNPPRIISLNLSSCQLKGKIATSLSNLKAIQSLDLSYNELSGPIPEFLAQLPNLKILNLAGNKLTGSVPLALMLKSKNKTLELSLEDYSKNCQTNACIKHHKKFLIQIVATVVLIPIIILGAPAIFVRIKRKRQEDARECESSCC